MEDVTGPPMLLQSLKAYNATLGLAHVKILEPGIIFPIDWRYTSQDWKNAGMQNTYTSADSCNHAGSDFHPLVVSKSVSLLIAADLC